MRLFFFTVVFALISGIAQAVPAYKGKLVYTQPDGKKVSYFVRGDEFSHSYYSVDGEPLAFDKNGFLLRVNEIKEADKVAAKMEATSLRRVSKQPVQQTNGPLRMPGKQDMPVKGDVKGLIILVEFPDQTFNEKYTPEVFWKMMNEEGYSLYDGDGSARDYFLSQSNGQFRPSFDVVGPVKMNTMSSVYAANNHAQVPYLVMDVCQKVHENFGVDFSKYDNDGNGDVDYVYLIYAGHGQNYGVPNTIWPHAYQLHNSHLSLSLDGVAIDSYALSCELRGLADQLDGIGTFCHEFSHVLGLADLYNTSNSGDVQLGSWDLMDVGCYNNDNRTPAGYSAFERSSMGWIELETLDKPMEDVTLENLAVSHKAYRLPSANKENEYFVLENRQNVGWDKYLPGHGMLVTHIDYQPNRWVLNNPNDQSPALVNIIEADGTQGKTFDGDPFPGSQNVTSLTDYTEPNMRGNDGSMTNKSLTNIREDAEGVIHFDLMADILKAPAMLTATDITADGFTARWNAVDGADSYSLHLAQLVADNFRPVLLGEDFEKMTEGSYLTPDNIDISDALDNYTAQNGWTGENVYQAGGYVKVGGYGVSGMLATPLLDLSENCDTVTVAFNGRAYTGKTVSVNVVAMDESGKKLLSEQVKVRATYADKAVAFCLSNLAAQLSASGTVKAIRFAFESVKERTYLDNVRVLRGNVDKDEAFVVDIPQMQIDGITDTQYTFTGLQPDTYAFKVKAVSSIESHSSAYSEEQTVVVAGEAAAVEGVDRIKCDFEHGIPDNFLLIDNDQNTPASGAAKLGFAVGQGWIPYYIDADDNHVAASTSWYKPAGTADDWMVLPALNVKDGAVLSWKAMAKDKKYCDGYAVLMAVASKPADELSAEDFQKADTLFAVSAEQPEWQFHSVDLADHIGKTVYIAFVNNTKDKAVLFVDDVFAGIAKAVALERDMAYLVKPDDAFAPSVVVATEKNEELKGFTVSCTLNGNTVTKDCSDVVLQPGVSQVVTFDGLKVSSGDNLDFLFEINGGGDRETVQQTVLVRPRRVVAEEFTGTWCGYCPRGMVAMKTAAESYPDNFIGIALHANQSATWPDKMECTDYLRELISAFNISGYPHSVTQRDRSLISDPQYIPDFVQYEMQQPLTSAVDMTLALDADTKTVHADATAYVNRDMEQADYRLAFVLVEDSVHHPEDKFYSQSNYYAGGASGTMGGFEKLPSTVPAELMYYNDVARSITGGIWGFEGALPSSVVAGKAYRYAVDIQIPETVDNLAQTSLVALLINARTMLLENAVKVKLPTGGDTSGLLSPIADNSRTAPRGHLYNLNGQRLTTIPATGIYIKDGKKLMVK